MVRQAVELESWYNDVFRERTMYTRVVIAGVIAIFCSACASEQPESIGSNASTIVDGRRIVQADQEPGNWLTHGRTYSEQRFSPLDQINIDNVSSLGVEWSYDTGNDRGHESTPIVADGRLYFTASWSVVHALDAATGDLLWTFDPEVPGAVGRMACCDVVNRGVALWKGRVYVAALDGRLIALDADTGTPDWAVQTTDPARPYTITGAPRVINDKVIIGNGGAEYGVRGYVTAYDAETGDQVWRFYTVPGDPSQPFEHLELETAAATWTGEWWEIGGGGTAWDSMAYDPELNLLYVGVGNGSPWTRQHRSPDGGDNLYLSSIIALEPDTGQLVWHYQTTPGDNWDYTATQHIILADLEIDGRLRQVLMQAPKNGFFYVIDRATGELLSAEKYVTVNWASHVDLETGRPVELPDGHYDEQPRVVLPSPSGGHNWHPMSFSPETGLVYIPAIESPFHYSLDENFEYNAAGWNVGIDLSRYAELLFQMPAPPSQGFLKAWDPVTQREVWSVEHPGAFNGGILSTAGNLVFQGSSDGRFVAYTADAGEKVWELPVNIGIVAPPISYELAGEQYIAVLAGWGGNVIVGMDAGLSAASHYENLGRLLVFKLDGRGSVPAVPTKAAPFLLPVPRLEYTEVELRGHDVYHQVCAVCHGILGVSSGVTSDLRVVSSRTLDAFDGIVRGEAFVDRGMPDFSDLLSAEDVEAVHAYLSKREAEDRSGQ